VRGLTRPTKVLKRHSPSLHYLSDSGEPESYEEALHVEDNDKWELVMNDEMKSLMKKQT